MIIHNKGNIDNEKLLL